MNESWPFDALPRDTEVNGYRVTQVLGRGGFGITYKAEDRIGQNFAVKEYFPRQFSVRQGRAVVPADTDSAVMFNDCLERFTKEARALTLFSSQGGGVDGVVRVITYFEANGTAYIVMEFLEGQCFDRVIAANPEGLPEPDLLRILRTLLPALAQVHANNLLHRDIKPANIFLRGNGMPVLLDFGAARVNAPGQTDTYSRIFTENYAPIEQMQGLPQGPFSDIYALGVTCYQAIAGRAYAPAGTMSITRQAALLGRQRDPLPPAAELGAGRYGEPLLAGIDWSLRVMPEDRPQNVAALAAVFGIALPAGLEIADATRLMTMAGGAAAATGETMVVPRGATSRAGYGTGFGNSFVDGATQALPRGTAYNTGQVGFIQPGYAPTPAKRSSALVFVLAAGVAVLAAGGAGYFVWQKQTPHGSIAAVSTTSAPATPAPSTPSPAPHAAGAATGDAALAAGDTATALQRYLDAARNGDAHAEYQLGYMYQNGVGVMADFTTALNWYHHAADSGYAPAQSQIGYMYLTGQTGLRDYGQALGWFRSAAKQHYAPAEFQLGYMAQHGLGMKRDFAQMQDYYNMAAQQNYAQAQQQLGYCYQMGLGVEKNPGEAVRWYTMAAEQKLPSAMYSLGQMYFAGIGVPADPATGRDWITRAADAGSTDARRWLATH